MKKFDIFFYNYIACQFQTFRVLAKDENDAERLFLMKYPKGNIEMMEEQENHHYYTEEELIKG